MDLLIDRSDVRANDRVLDVACGPGIVACAMAARARHVVGLDFTPAMLEQATTLQAEQKLQNVEWRQGTAVKLPFVDASFDLVITRFSFHHYRDPYASFGEMVRVTRPGGTILVADVAPRADARQAYDELEKQRDPSHTRALTEEEFENIGSSSEAEFVSKHRYDLESDVDGLLGSSFPPPGGAEIFRAQVAADADALTDSLSIRAHRRDGALWLYFPVLISLWKRKGTQKLG
jgi:SAM-dependent methyltransferase